MLNTIVITRKPQNYPNYATYTAHEFLVLNELTLRNIEMVMIDERISTKKLRKVRNRMAAFSIVEIDILPDEDVRTRLVDLPRSGLTIEIKEGASVEEIRKTMLKHLREAADKLLKETGFDPSKLRLAGPSDFWIDAVVPPGIEPQLDKPATKGLKFSTSMRSTLNDSSNMCTGPSARLPLDRLLSEYNRLHEEDFVKRLKDGTLLGGEAGKNLRDSAEELKRELLARRPGVYRSKSVPPGVIIHKRRFTAGEERHLKVKPWLENPQVVQLFKSRQELADYLVAKLPEGTELRKRNALKFKICVELSEDKVLTLAADRDAQVALVNKYC